MLQTIDGRKQFAEVYPAANAELAGDGTQIVTSYEDGTVSVWRRDQSEEWWSIFARFDLWLAVAMAFVLKWSYQRDKKTLVPAKRENARTIAPHDSERLEKEEKG